MLHASSRIFSAIPIKQKYVTKNTPLNFISTFGTYFEVNEAHKIQELFLPLSCAIDQLIFSCENSRKNETPRRRFTAKILRQFLQRFDGVFHILLFYGENLWKNDNHQAAEEDISRRCFPSLPTVLATPQIRLYPGKIQNRDVSDSFLKAIFETVIGVYFYANKSVSDFAAVNSLISKVFGEGISDGGCSQFIRIVAARRETRRWQRYTNWFFEFRISSFSEFVKSMFWGKIHHHWVVNRAAVSSNFSWFEFQTTAAVRSTTLNCQ